MVRRPRAMLATVVVAFFVALVVSGCTIFRPDPAEAIMGNWQSSVRGYPVTVVYTGTTVQVDGANPVSYSLSGDELRHQDGGSEVRIVSFPSRDEMVMTDPRTGAEQRYTRIGN